MPRPLRFLLVLSTCFGLPACSNDTATNPTNSSPTFATFSSIQGTVFSPRCAVSGCHNGAERPTLSAGAAYNNIVNVRSTQGLDYIEPGNADNSYLYRKLTGVNISGDRMPRGQAPLAQAVMDSIRVWIQNGAPNN